jgi:hypothetical protein
VGSGLRGVEDMGQKGREMVERGGGVQALVEKGLPFTPISPQTIRPAAKGGISPGSLENVSQGALVPVQRCPLVPVFVNNRG